MLTKPEFLRHRREAIRRVLRLSKQIVELVRVDQLSLQEDLPERDLLVPAVLVFAHQRKLDVRGRNVDTVPARIWRCSTFRIDEGHAKHIQGDRPQAGRDVEQRQGPPQTDRHFGVHI